MASSAHILVVEDDERIGSTLLRALDGSGYDARWERTGADAVAAARDRRPDLVLLDLGLPDADGLDVCRALLEDDPTLAVVMMTALDLELDIVVGLDAGAVDYVTKPFKLAELLARVRAQLRRAAVVRAASAPPQRAVDDLAIDPAARRVWLGGRELALRAKEFDLLARLMADAGHVVSRETLINDVWDENWVGSTKTLDFHVAALRRKVDGAREISRITTLRGVGYRFEVP